MTRPCLIPVNQPCRASDRALALVNLTAIFWSTAHWRYRLPRGYATPPVCPSSARLDTAINLMLKGLTRK
jgi:hypothetical protein